MKEIVTIVNPCKGWLLPPPESKPSDFFLGKITISEYLRSRF